MRHLHRLVGDACRHQQEFPVRGRLRRAAVLAGRRRRAAEHHHRRRDPVGAAQPAARGIQGRRQILRLFVEAGDPGGLAREHRLSADHPRRLRSHPRAGLLRPQSRRCDLDRADDAEAADREFAGAAARLVRPDPRCDRRRAGAGVLGQEIRASRAIPRSSAATACCASSNAPTRTGRNARCIHCRA